MILLIDNYDSFTYNLAHLIGGAGATFVVKRNDEVTAAEILADLPEAIVLSPGPCTPNEAGACLDIVKETNGAAPLFGVCLGHQTIGQAYGGEVVRSGKLMHGKISTVSHDGTGLFQGLPQDFEATRYHSLSVKRETLPDSLAITADSPDGEIMGLQVKGKPVFGVQFHPESIASEHGDKMIRSFLKIAKEARP